ncbi:hypothetical protein [Nocardioides cynanchi]|uniref:hypothetical protein n=1 Tax=Nocardioides cynanchi TaxID=2558918 RepID=UPI0012485540|nr:hypothetical protein [Nocardioides cynanchi]
MTERLITLLHAEAETLDVPPAPTAEILGTGRRLQRRRTRTIWGTTALALALVGGGAAVALNTGGQGPDVAPTQVPTVTVPFAWGVDDTVYLGTEARAVPMPEVAQTLYYTSAGILVRTNKDGSSDGGAPFHFELVTPDGTATRLGVTLGEVVPSADPTEPYLAWATRVGDRIQVVVHDVATDRDVATVDVPGTYSWGGWPAPPVSLAGDRVFVSLDDSTAVVNWRTGTTTTSSVLPGGTFPEVSGGRTVRLHGRATDHASAAVVDAATGSDLLDIPISQVEQVSLSPDGRFAMVASAGPVDPRSQSQASSTQVYDVDAGTHVSVDVSPFDVGWTPQDDLFGVRGDQLTLCGATTGTCHSSTVPRATGNGLVRYTGRVYES